MYCWWIGIACTYFAFVVVLLPQKSQKTGISTDNTYRPNL